jgi:hypothetical protein
MEVGVLVGGRGEEVGVGGSDVDVGVEAITIEVYVGMGSDVGARAQEARRKSSRRTTNARFITI